MIMMILVDPKGGEEQNDEQQKRVKPRNKLKIYKRVNWKNVNRVKEGSMKEGKGRDIEKARKVEERKLEAKSDHEGRKEGKQQTKIKLNKQIRNRKETKSKNGMKKERRKDNKRNRKLRGVIFLASIKPEICTANGSADLLAFFAL
jgi:hypothetical protein